MDRRRVAGLLVALVIAGVAALGAALLVDRSHTPAVADDPAAIARELAGHLRVEARVADSSNGVIRASADFGIEEGVRAVPVRIVEDLELRLTITSDREIVFATPPRVCLVGPFWNPLDAGLSDRCWGEPDLGRMVAEGLRRDDGELRVESGDRMSLDATIERGTERCDYAPGEWRLQIDAELRLGATALPRVDVVDIPLDLPLEPVGTVLPFHPNSETRPCSYVAAVYTRQGEPLFAPD